MNTPPHAEGGSKRHTVPKKFVAVFIHGEAALPAGGSHGGFCAA
jgi:hypothetical protein